MLIYTVHNNVYLNQKNWNKRRKKNSRAQKSKEISWYISMYIVSSKLRQGLYCIFCFSLRNILTILCFGREQKIYILITKAFPYVRENQFFHELTNTRPCHGLSQDRKFIDKTAVPSWWCFLGKFLMVQSRN